MRAGSIGRKRRTPSSRRKGTPRRSTTPACFGVRSNGAAEADGFDSSNQDDRHWDAEISSIGPSNVPESVRPLSKRRANSPLVTLSISPVNSVNVMELVF